VYPWDGEPADWHGQLTPLRDTPREDNAAWREHVITQERAERDSATGVTTKPAVT
jgi:hypothetical protein